MVDREPIHKRLIVVGDRVLIAPDEGEDRSDVGLYLPRWAVEKEAIQAGRVVAVGPGIPLPALESIEAEPWKEPSPDARHVPMQARIGDYALFLRKAAVEIKFEGKTYLIIPQGAILLLDRNPPEAPRVTDDDEEEEA